VFGKVYGLVLACILYPAVILLVLAVHYQILWEEPWVLITTMVLVSLLWRRIWQAVASNVLALIIVPHIWNLISTRVVENPYDLGVVSLMIGVNVRSLTRIFATIILQAAILVMLGYLRRLKQNKTINH